MENDSNKPSGGARLLRFLAFGLAGLLIVVVVLYFVVSSSAFIKAVILPRVGKALNADITVQNVSLSPFSQLTVSGLKVQPRGAEPLLTADQVRVRYSLLSFLRGVDVVNELSIGAPVLQIVRSNGVSNLDSFKGSSNAQPSTAHSTAPMRVALRNISLKDATVRLVDFAKDGSSKTTQLSALDVTLDRFENGQPGKLGLATAVQLQNRPAPAHPGTNDILEGKINGSFSFTLNSRLLPETLTGSAQLGLSRTEGAYAELAGLEGSFQAEMTPTQVRQLAFRFERAGQPLGRLALSGPLDLAKSEGRLTLEIQSVDRQVLNVWGAGQGLDFGSTVLNATNIVEISHQGDSISAKGEILGHQVSLRKQGQVTPPLDLALNYEVTVNRPEETALLNQLSLVGQQQQNELLRASLDRPMSLTWASTARGFGGSTFQLSVKHLDLGEWQPVLGTNLPSGRLNVQLTVVAMNDAKRLSVTNTLEVQSLSARFGTNEIRQADLTAALDGTVENLKTVSIDHYQLQIQQADQPLVKVNGSAHADLSSNDRNVQINAELALPAWLRQFPMAGLSVSNGLVRLSTSYTQRDQKQSATGNLSLAGFTGQYGNYTVGDLAMSLDYNADVDGAELGVHNASLTLRRGYAPGGNLTASGSYNLEKKIAQLNFKVIDLNQNALEPLLAPALEGQKLNSISLNGSGSANYDPGGQAALKTELSITNWVVSDPRRNFTSPNLSAQAQVEGVFQQNVLDLKNLALQLPPTDKAANNGFRLSGRLDFSPTNASPSQVRLESSSLDLTPYYNMFAGAPKNTPEAKQRPNNSTGPASASGAPRTEPAPAHLPLEQLTADAKFDRLFLREVAITNLQASAKINHGQVTLDPVQLSLNGAPVSAKAALNLAVQGYTYDFSMNAERVPLAPLANSFSTNSPSQKLGELIAQARLKGAGITDLNLKKNLSGDLSISLTNMSYDVLGPKVDRLLRPISVVLNVPELMQTPISWVSAKAQVGSGQLDLQEFMVQSQAFYAESHGTVALADVLTNSPLNLPVNLSLRRSLSDKAHLTPANSPTNTDYAQLPGFVTLAGTLGNPKTEINKLVVGGLVMKTIGGIPGGQAGAILQGLGGLISGQKAPASGTNAPANTNAAANIIQGVSSFVSGLGKRAGTNAPAATNTTKTPAKPSILDLLK